MVVTRTLDSAREVIVIKVVGLIVVQMERWETVAVILSIVRHKFVIIILNAQVYTEIMGTHVALAVNVSHKLATLMVNVQHIMDIMETIVGEIVAFVGRGFVISKATARMSTEIMEILVAQVMIVNLGLAILMVNVQHIMDIMETIVGEIVAFVGRELVIGMVNAHLLMEIEEIIVNGIVIIVRRIDVGGMAIAKE
jgi:hypothetical protein